MKTVLKPVPTSCHCRAELSWKYQFDLSTPVACRLKPLSSAQLNSVRHDYLARQALPAAVARLGFKWGCSCCAELNSQITLMYLSTFFSFYARWMGCFVVWIWRDCIKFSVWNRCRAVVVPLPNQIRLSSARQSSTPFGAGLMCKFYFRSVRTAVMWHKYNKNKTCSVRIICRYQQIWKNLYYYGEYITQCCTLLNLNPGAPGN